MPDETRCRRLYVRRTRLADVGCGWRQISFTFVCTGTPANTRSSYNKPALSKWATRIQRWLKENRHVHVYFDNDAEGAAPENVLTLLEMLR